MSWKTCSLCERRKDIEEFPRGTSTSNTRRRMCKTCKTAQQSLYNPPTRTHEYHRNANLKRNYGITSADYDAMLTRQGGVCAICKKPSDQSFHVEHDHESGLVRGLCCSRCNHVLGHSKESQETLFAAQIYLLKDVDLLGSL